MPITKAFCLIIALLFSLSIVGKMFIMYLTAKYNVKATAKAPEIEAWMMILWAIFLGTYLSL